MLPKICLTETFTLLSLTGLVRCEIHSFIFLPCWSRHTTLPHFFDENFHVLLKFGKPYSYQFCQIFPPLHIVPQILTVSTLICMFHQTVQWWSKCCALQNSICDPHYQPSLTLQTRWDSMNQVRAVNTAVVLYSHFHDGKYDQSKYSCADGLHVSRSLCSHTDTIENCTQSWTVTRKQLCDLCPTVTIATGDLSQGSSCAVHFPKASPNPSRLSITKCHLSSSSLSFLFPLSFNFLCPVYF